MSAIEGVTTTETVNISETETLQDAPTLRLCCHKPENKKKVKWTQTTVDNEGMNKKKSKCCCVYVKTKEFGESSSESEGECENCSGHVEKQKKEK